MPHLLRLAGPALAMVPVLAQQWQLQESLPARQNPALTFDLARGEALVFGGMRGGSLLGDLWAFDGSRWHRRTATNAPSPRSGAALAFDSQRGRTVLFGGMVGWNPAVYGNDTWEHDGITWTQVPTAHAPSARTTRMTYDSVRGQVVLFGGLDGTGSALADTWTYAGSDWTQVNTVNGPGSVIQPSPAFDSARGRTVLLHCAQSVTTWEFDGTHWTQQATAHVPTWRSYHALAYDQVRQRIVCYGGTGQGIPSQPNLTDTWEYDGIDWTQRQPATNPGPQWPTMTYDPLRQATVLLGGGSQLTASVWTWDGTDWSDHSGPSIRQNPALAHDVRRDRTILFGGSNSGPLRDTWEHDGTTWRRNPNGDGPLYLEGAAMAHDLHRDRTVLFGGAFLWAVYDQTWEYDGATWTVRSPAMRPAARMGHQMAYDAGRRRTVLFGGALATNSTPGNDTWEYDGTTWLPITPQSILPAARMFGALVYDAAATKVLLFGGTGNLSAAGFSDTWYWDGSAWVQQAPAHRPTARHAHGLAYDLRRGRTVLFGGRANNVIHFSDTWEFDGFDWSQVVIPAADGTRATPLVYRPASGAVIGFGGRDANDQPHDGTIEFTPAASASVGSIGRGCAGSAGVPSLRGGPGAVPSLGSTFPLVLQGVPAAPGLALLAFGFDLTHWQGAPLPRALDDVGLAGCDLWIGPLTGLSVLLGTAGSGSYGLLLPADPAFAGLILTAQALSLDAAAGNGLGATSNGLALRLF